MLRRAVDIVVALALSLIFTIIPVFLITVILVKLSSPGPILFTQKRYGRDRKVFTVYKFRALTTHNSKGRVEDMVIPGDPRVTRIGNFLRTYKLDEVPQLLNVLRGDMSLIGPRPTPIPESEEFAKQFPKFFDRLQIKPGLTGLKQVWQFKNEASKSRRNFLRLDLCYVRHRSLRLDLWILWRTVPLLLRGKLN